MQSSTNDMIKNQLMTMLMMKNAQTTNKSSGFMDIIQSLYSIIIISSIDKIINYLSTLFSILKTYLEKKFTKEFDKKVKQIIQKVPNINEEKKQKISIMLSINANDGQNLLGQAILDCVTKSSKTTSTLYYNNLFILNTLDPIQLNNEQIFIKLQELPKVVTDETSKNTANVMLQNIELYSYEKSMDELRDFLNKIKNDYYIKIQNKLGDQLYYFNELPSKVPYLMPQQNSKPKPPQKDLSQAPLKLTFNMKPFYTNKTFTNLFGPEIV
jgi:hypothetical protein